MVVVVVDEQWPHVTGHKLNTIWDVKQRAALPSHKTDSSSPLHRFGVAVVEVSVCVLVVVEDVSVELVTDDVVLDVTVEDVSVELV